MNLPRVEFLMVKEDLLLVIPGPVPIAPSVYRAMIKPVIGHRTPQFRELNKQVHEMLKEIMCTKNDVFVLAGSGTLAMQAGISNLVAPDDEVLNLVNGKFSNRFAEITEAFGGKSIVHNVEYGKAIKPPEVEKALEENPNIKFVTMTLNETSTAILNPVWDIGKITREQGKILIVDGITAVGGDYVYADEWNIDVLITGSQKCLGIPPGLSAIMVAPTAWEVINNRETIYEYYANLKKYKKSYEKGGDTPFTPAVTLVQGLHESLRLILEEGIENRVKRHRLITKAVREGYKAMGLELLAEEEYASNTITAIKYPENIEDKEFRSKMEEKGILVAGGQDHLKGKIFRIASLNLCTQREVLTILATSEIVLKELGYNLKLGSGTTAAQKVFLTD